MNEIRITRIQTFAKVGKTFYDAYAAINSLNTTNDRGTANFL